MKDNYKNKILVLTILTIVFTIMGSTLAFWNWNTSEVQKTLIGFTVEQNLSCTGDGGGNITSSEKNIVPTSCTNQEYAIQRTITLNTSSTISTNDIFLDLWLDVIDIGEGLTNSKNFKYALTKQANDCQTNQVASGTFNGVTNNGRVSLLTQKKYIGTSQDTYYLYIWLDSAETSTDTMNQSFELSLGGNCLDEPTIGWYSYNGYTLPDINEVWTDKETYPYAMIEATTEENGEISMAYLEIYSQKLYVNSDNKWFNEDEVTTRDFLYFSSYSQLELIATSFYNTNLEGLKSRGIVTGRWLDVDFLSTEFVTNILNTPPTDVNWSSSDLLNVDSSINYKSSTPIFVEYRNKVIPKIAWYSYNGYVAPAFRLYNKSEYPYSALFALELSEYGFPGEYMYVSYALKSPIVKGIDGDLMVYSINGTIDYKMAGYGTTQAVVDLIEQMGVSGFQSNDFGKWYDYILPVDSMGFSRLQGAVPIWTNHDIIDKTGGSNYLNKSEPLLVEYRNLD